MLYGGTSLDQKIQKGLYIFACTNSVMDPIVYGYFNLRKSNRNNRNQVGENSIPIYKWMVWGAQSFKYFIIKGFAVIVRCLNRMLPWWIGSIKALVSKLRRKWRDYVYMICQQLIKWLGPFILWSFVNNIINFGRDKT